MNPPRLITNGGSSRRLVWSFALLGPETCWSTAVRALVLMPYRDDVRALRLTDRAAADAGKDVDEGRAGETRVIVYYSDEAGRKVAHFFKKTS